MPETTTGELILKCKAIGGSGQMHITAAIGGELIHSDKLDVGRATARDRFCRALAERCPQIDRADVGAELLRLAGETAGSTAAPDDTAEIDVSRLARPELFHAPGVSGLAVSVIVIADGKPVSRWQLHTRWADGDRQRQDLPRFLVLPSGERIWIEPQPAAPAITQPSGWSMESRDAWLQGSRALPPHELFREVSQAIAFHLDFAAEHAAGTTAVLALWSILTYAFPAWDAVPYLSISGPLGSGKTRAFEVLARTVYRPLPSANVTAPTLFRTLHEFGGTLLLDEAERLKDQTPDAGEIRSILLSGYKAGSPARRLEPTGDRKFTTRTFDVYGPKAIAGIAGLSPALQSRCIPVLMFRAAPNSPKPRRQIDADPRIWQRIRDDLHVAALEYGQEFRQLSHRVSVCPDMSGRDFEVWQPILALAHWIEDAGADKLLDLVRGHALHVIDQNRDEGTPDADEHLLQLLAGHVLDGTHIRTQPADLLKQAMVRDPILFGRWSPRGVSSVLKRYGITTDKRHGRRTFANVGTSHLLRIEASYGLDLDLPEDVRGMGGTGV